MSCKCSIPTDQYHGYECAVTGGECAFIFPDSVACAIQFQEGPDADKTPQELTAMVEAGESILHEIAEQWAEAERRDEEREEYYDRLELWESEEY